MCSDGSADTDVVCACFDRLTRSHESLLIARFCPARANSLDRNLDFVSEFATKRFDFTRTGDDSMDSSFDAQSGKAQDLVFYCVGDSNFAQRLFARAG